MSLTMTMSLRGPLRSMLLSHLGGKVEAGLGKFLHGMECRAVTQAAAPTLWNEITSGGSFPRRASNRPMWSMEKDDRPAVRRALRQAQLYGYLIARHGRLLHPGGNHPLCDVQTSKDIVRSGWLRYRSGRYEITPEGLRVLVAAEYPSELAEHDKLPGAS